MSNELWLRKLRLIVQTGDGQEVLGLSNAVDLADYRVTFRISQALKGKPCTAEVMVYNVSQEDFKRIDIPVNAKNDQNRMRMVIEAGYQSGSGTIFSGEVYWRTSERESRTDMAMRLVAVSSYKASRYAVVNTTLPKGASQLDVINAVLAVLQANGVETGEALTRAGELMPAKLPKAKTLYGSALQYCWEFAQTNNLSFAIGNKGIEFFSNAGRDTAVGEVIEIGVDTGMIDYPRLTTEGLEVTTLLNHRLEMGAIVKLTDSANSLIRRGLYDTSYGSKNFTADNSMLSPSGLYEVVSVEHEGDSRGDAWYTKIICRGLGAEVKMTPGATNFFPNQ